jgi:hypothetical protein
VAVPPPPPHAAPAPTEGDTVMSVEEWREAGARALKRLGISYAELEDQAKNKNFASTAARKLWMLVGGTL